MRGTLPSSLSLSLSFSLSLSLPSTLHSTPVHHFPCSISRRRKFAGKEKIRGKERERERVRERAAGAMAWWWTREGVYDVRKRFGFRGGEVRGGVRFRSLALASCVTLGCLSIYEARTQQKQQVQVRVELESEQGRDGVGVGVGDGNGDDERKGRSLKRFRRWLTDVKADTNKVTFQKCTFVEHHQGKGLVVKGGRERERVGIGNGNGNGNGINFGFGTEKEELGVFANEKVPKFGKLQRWATNLLTFGQLGGEYLVADFPFRVVFTPATPLRDENKAVGEIFEKALQSGELDAREVIILYLILQEKRGRSSSWSPYMDLLPKNPKNCAMMQEEDLELIRGTNLFNAVVDLQKKLPEDFSGRICAVAKALTEAEGRQAAAAENEGGNEEITYDDYVRFFSIFWSRTLALPVPLQNGKDWVQMDGLVPGLDFVNHSYSNANSRWQVKAPGVVELYATRPMIKGEQIYIQYGERSNEQLMFQYGFAEADNPNDSLMLHCVPLGAKMLRSSDKKELEEWHSRLALAKESELPLHVFLQAGTSVDLPEKFMGTLEVLVGNPPSSSSSSPSFAALTLFCKIMQQCVYQQESDEEGTGTLENDEKLLFEQEVDVHKKHCIIYRMGQKKIARAYLRLAQEELSKFNL